MSKVASITLLCIVLVVLSYFCMMKSPSSSTKKPKHFKPVKENYSTLYVDGVVPNSPWMNVLSNFQLNDGLGDNTYLLDFPQQRKNECAYYNGPYAPRTPQDCPNSSFDFITDMSKYIPGSKHAGCIQLGTTSIPYCYSDAQGKYKVWNKRLQAFSA
jgi:hypothetical protein